jgi:hypothetical protein
MRDSLIIFRDFLPIYSELLTIYTELRLIYSEFCNVEITTVICPLLKRIIFKKTHLIFREKLNKENFYKNIVDAPASRRIILWV